jgi:hypothetical protein
MHKQANNVHVRSKPTCADPFREDEIISYCITIALIRKPLVTLKLHCNVSIWGYRYYINKILLLRDTPSHHCIVEGTDKRRIL